MKRFATNISLLMDLLSISSKDLCDVLQVDPSVISRWRNGERRLIYGREWAGKLACYFVQSNPTEVMGLLRTVCPLEVTTGMDIEHALEKWLCQPPEDNHDLIMNTIMRRPNVRYLDGDETVRRVLWEFLDYMLTLRGPGEILFACPDGLSIFTRDSKYNLPLQANLWKVFQHGFRLKTVLRTDYRVSDVALACGPWLSAHLHGYIQSYYYDDFCVPKEEKILICLPGHLAIQVMVNIDSTKAQIWTDLERINEVQLRFQTYLEKSKQRFRYRFLEDPKGFLADTRLQETKPAFFFNAILTLDFWGWMKWVNFSVSRIPNWNCYGMSLLPY